MAITDYNEVERLLSSEEPDLDFEVSLSIESAVWELLRVYRPHAMVTANCYSDDGVTDVVKFNITQ